MMHEVNTGEPLMKEVLVKGDKDSVGKEKLEENGANRFHDGGDGEFWIHIEFISPNQLTIFSRTKDISTQDV